MIIQLQPEQITAYWPAIKHGIMIANRFDGGDVLAVCNQMLADLLVGKAQCWVSTKDTEHNRDFEAVGITTIVKDSAFRVPYLFLHTLYAFRPICEENLNNLVPTLERFAREAGCGALITLTKIERLQKLYLASGFTDDQRLYIKTI